MTERLCTEEGCKRKYLARGYCRMHYARWRKSTDSFVPMELHSKPLEERLKDDTERRGGCLIWTGGTVPRGYGYVGLRGKTVYIHRWVYEREHGAIPKGMVIDHICHMPSCVELSHLRLATYSENNSYRSGAMPGSATGVRNVHPHGPGFNVCIKKNGKKYRFGTYPTIEQAAEVAEAKRAELFGAFAGGA